MHFVQPRSCLHLGRSITIAQRLAVLTREDASGAVCSELFKRKGDLSKAREMNINEDEIRQAIDVGKMVRKGAAGQMDKLIEELSK